MNDKIKIQLIDDIGNRVRIIYLDNNENKTVIYNGKKVLLGKLYTIVEFIRYPLRSCNFNQTKKKRF